MPVKFNYQYPGDPLDTVELLFGAEFLKRFPKRDITISGFGVGVPVTRIPVTEVVCDSCNAEVLPHEPCSLSPSGLQCWECTKEYVLPHLKGEAK